MNIGLALATAALLILTFPRFDFVWLAPVALAPLLIAVARESRLLRRFLLGYMAGVAYWFGVCYWIQFVLEFHGGMGVVGSWGTFLLFCLAKALHMGAFAVLAGAVIHRSYALPAVAALWVAIERTHGPLGFAWQALGNAGIDMAMPMRLAPYTGVYGLSFVFAMLGAALAVVVLRRRRRELLWLLSLGVLYVLPPVPERRHGAEQAVLVQPNLSETEDYSMRSLEETYRRVAYLSLQAVLSPRDAPPRLLVWPEVPAPFYYYNDPRFRDQVTSLARLTQTYFLFGTVAYTPDGAPLNSAVMLGPDGELVGRYDKMFLVPFGEYVPRLFGFVNKITSEAGNFQPGRSLVIFPVGDQRIGAFICYEAVFPHLVRRFAAGGAGLLVNISNDGYFGRSAAREQHLKIVRMRAVENHRWILRTTNDGVTVAIDPAGQIRDRLPPYKEAAMLAQFSYVRELTPYTRFGDWFAFLCTLGGIAALALSLRPQRSPRVTVTRGESGARHRP